MIRVPQRGALALLICAFAALWAASGSSTRAGEIKLSPEAQRALDQVYEGNPAAAVDAARAIEQAQPENPLGYAIEAEAEWWQVYCAACEVKWGMIDAWKRDKLPADDAYYALADKVTSLARAQLANSETAEGHVYAGVGFAFKARLYALTGDSHKAAHASVAGRAEFLRALQLDPDQGDASAGLGIYNYFVDSLSPIIKLLRVFMGIPGGNKEEGIRQLKIAMEHGTLMRVVARFYLARNLRTFDHKYEDALAVAIPLTERYPRNPVFLALAGNLNVELGRKDTASEYFRSAERVPSTDSTCPERIRKSIAALLPADRLSEK